MEVEVEVEGSLVDVSSALAFLRVMPGLLGLSLLCKPDERSKVVTFIILLPGTRFKGVQGGKRESEIKIFQAFEDKGADMINLASEQAVTLPVKRFKGGKNLKFKVVRD